MTSLNEKDFEFLNEGKGIWILKYGTITEEIEYTNENFINKDKTIGYCKMETKKKDIIHIFFSKTDEKEIITSTGLQEDVFQYKNVILTSVQGDKSFESYCQAHEQAIKNLTLVSDKKNFDKILKGNALPSKLYEIIKDIAVQKLTSPESLNAEKYQEKYQKYLKFIDEKFTQISRGSGSWFIPYGEKIEKIKYKVENFLNKENNIGYCKVARKDGLVFHVFVSHYANKDTITISGLYNAQIDLALDGILVNTVDMHSDLETHYLAHVKSYQGNPPLVDRKYLENRLGKNKLANQIYSIIKKAVIKTMGLSKLWTSEKIDNIIRKYLHKATKL